MNKRGTMIDPEYDNRYIEFTQEQLLALKDMYLAGQSTRKLSKRYGISPTTVQRRLQAMGVVLRDITRNYLVTDSVLETANRMRSAGARWKHVEAATGVKPQAIMGAIRRNRKRAVE